MPPLRGRLDPALTDGTDAPKRWSAVYSRKPWWLKDTPKPVGDAYAAGYDSTSVAVAAAWWMLGTPARALRNGVGGGRREARPAARRTARRGTARSGQDPGDSDPEPEPELPSAGHVDLPWPDPVALLTTGLLRFWRAA